MISDRAAATLPCERRIGKYSARAASDESYAVFERDLLDATRAVLTSPSRMVGLPHLINATASRLGSLERSEKALIEGYLLQWISDSLLGRLMTVSRGFLPYQIIYWSDLRSAIEDGVEQLSDALRRNEYLTLESASLVIPRSLPRENRDVEVLFGHLLYLGLAACDSAPSLPIELIRLPYAAPRF
jgi:hypothetical protein